MPGVNTLHAGVVLLAASVVSGAMAQTPELDRQREYWRQQEEQRQEQQRRAQEEMQRQERATEEQRKKRQEEYDEQSRRGDARREAEEAPKRRARMAQDAQNAADMKAARARLLAMPPLPDERNPLLGRWRVDGGAKLQRKDEMGLLLGMLANPGGAACQMMFGGGITEFRSKSWASIDGHGDDSLGPIAYRSDGKRVFAIPAKGVELMGFDVADRNRAVSSNLEGCTLVRVAAASTATSTTAAPPAAAAVVDGAAFRCGDGSLLHVSLCQGASANAVCKLTELHLPGLQMGKPARRADIAARVNGCEAGGIRYGADNKAVFVR